MQHRGQHRRALNCYLCPKSATMLIATSEATLPLRFPPFDVDPPSMSEAVGGRQETDEGRMNARSVSQREDAILQLRGVY